MNDFKLGDSVYVEKAEIVNVNCVGKRGIVIHNPNPSNGCVRVKFEDGESVDLKPEWLELASHEDILNSENMREQAPYGVSCIADRSKISFEENAEVKSRLTPKAYPTFRDIIEEMAKTYEKKNADYGDSFGISVRKYGNIAALTRMSDKFNRIENLILNDNAQVKDESLLDSLKDLACYCVMTVMAIEINDFEDVK